MAWKRITSLVFLMAMGTPASSQEVAPPAASNVPVALTLKRAVELALTNSKDIRLAKLQVQAAQDSAQLTHSEFLPNLYAGSGAGYTYGLPETPGGRPPALFSITYTQQIFNGPLSGLAKEQQEQVRAQRAIMEDTKNIVMVRVASSYLELVKVRHSLELLRGEKDSADKIVDVTKERESEGFELPVEVTRAQLTRAQVEERILQLEGRQDELEVYLRNQTGMAPDQPIEVTPEDLPGAAEQEGANLIAMATQNNASLLAAESDVRGKEFRLKGEKRGYWPSLQLVSIYDVLAKYSFNNYTNITQNFQYNNLNAGVNINVPIFSAKTRASVALAQVNLDAAKITLANTRTQVSADVRQKSRKVQQADAAKEVARLELQLAQQNLAVLQSQFGEGKVSLRDVEKARLDENEKWMAYLDANFQRQQAQLDLLKTAGQLDKVLE
ncbi:MAG TPA: TolC family protein [Candidatus Eisenbacteria bacterium]|nr:TolC family protein [Candidatus Eisenbacteria bacterium]